MESFFMGMPGAGGFDNASKTKGYEKTSVFFFTDDAKNKSKAYYEAVSGVQTLKLLKEHYNNEHLRNTCLFINKPRADTTSLITVEKGCAMLVNGKWVVLHKAIIHFEAKPATVNAGATVSGIVSAVKEHAQNTAMPPRTVNIGAVLPKSVPTEQPPIPEPAKSGQQAVYTNFYLGAPDKNLFQNYSRSARHKPGITMYEFTHDANKYYAEFRLVFDAEIIKLVRNNYLQYINSACESANAPTIHTNEVRTVRGGIAVLEDNIWRIVEKSKIIYE